MPLLSVPAEGHEAIGEARLDSVTNTEDIEACWPLLVKAAERGLKAIVGALLASGADKEVKHTVRGRRVQGESGADRCGSNWFGFIACGE